LWCLSPFSSLHLNTMVFGHILRTMLYGAAKEKVREAVTEAATEQMSPKKQPGPVEVAVIFAMGIESGGLEDLLEDTVTTRGEGIVIRQGTLEEKSVAVVISGVGRKAAARATEAVISGHEPKLIISAGLAGGLVDALKRPDILIADSVADPRGNRLTIHVPKSLGEAARQPGVNLGRLLTADGLVRTSAEKKAAGREHESMAVDMETFAVAEVCAKRSVQFSSIRTISDTVDETLPKDIENLLSQKSTSGQLGAAAGALFRRPSSIGDMYRLKENALVCSDHLAKFLAAMIRRDA